MLIIVIFFSRHFFSAKCSWEMLDTKIMGAISARTKKWLKSYKFEIVVLPWESRINKCNSATLTWIYLEIINAKFCFLITETECLHASATHLKWQYALICLKTEDSKVSSLHQNSSESFNQSLQRQMFPPAGVTALKLSKFSRETLKMSKFLWSFPTDSRLILMQVWEKTWKMTKMVKGYPFTFLSFWPFFLLLKCTEKKGQVKRFQKSLQPNSLRNLSFSLFLTQTPITTISKMFESLRKNRICCKFCIKIMANSNAKNCICTCTCR